ncbi:hypothetical protein ACFV2S_09580 [Streptomyces sp. NPDC059695]|uniref:hypothetical protein n=1 Tax=Streptomyces sp. NPDC059695 TaxID=3346910 RepID=UPI003682EB98
MDIPDGFRWVFVALAVLQLFSLGSLLRRMRAPEAERRVDARIDLLDSVSSLLLLAGLGFSHLTAMFVGLGLMGLALTLKGVRFLRARRHA